MEYIGEHLWAGQLGRLAVILSFTSALLGVWAYARYWQRETHMVWRNVARTSVYLHGFSVFTTLGILFYMIFNHYFEYDYVWKHSSMELDMQYIFSSFWEGQEGSFLLWMIWHVVLALILMNTARRWESSTMVTVLLVQAFLSSMILGVYIGDLKIGQSPFVLIRELPEYIGLPWTEMPNYLQAIPAFLDGQGLNPLLQNYWMTIHPPTLFLGFAATVVPFAYAIAGLLTGDHKGWVKPTLPWAYFGVGILGTGILMGGAWAYEALSFGGFWAWDPVENASLVPWLMLVGAAHLMLLQKNRGGALPSTYLLTILSFVLIVYSTFLTRSGILGDSSVHSFVDLGLSGQLLLYLLFFMGASLALYLWRFREFRNKKVSEDDLSSREFWMFIGAMVLLLSSLQITFSTSADVWNALIGPDGAIFPLMSREIGPPEDAITHYNQYQVPFAIAITILVALGQFLNYRRTLSKEFWKNIALSLLISAVVAGLASWAIGFTNPVFILLMFTSSWAILANLDFLLRIGRRWKGIAGSSVAHVGFGLIILGSLISNGDKDFISKNHEFIHKDFPANKNLMLVKGDTVNMAPYRVQWVGDELKDGDRIFTINFWEGNDPEPSFQLTPFIQLNESMGNVPEPSTKHYWNRDVFTHITFADMRDSLEKSDPWQQKLKVSMKTGEEVVIYDTYMLRLDSVPYTLDTANRRLRGVHISAHVTLTAMDNTTRRASPLYELQGSEEVRTDAEIEDFGIKLSFQEVNPETDQIVLHVWKHQDTEEDFILIQAIVFPHINLLWLGCIVMALGTFIAVYQRVRRKE